MAVMPPGSGIQPFTPPGSQQDDPVGGQSSDLTTKLQQAGSFSALGGLDSSFIDTSQTPARNPIGPLRFAPYTQADLNAPANWGPERIRTLQLDLAALGLLDPGYQLAFWDAPTRRAYENVVQYANINGVSVDSALSYMKEIAGRYGVTKAKAKVTPLTISLTNPDSVANLAQELAVRTMGRRLDDGEARNFASAYNQLERDYQLQRYNMQVAAQQSEATDATVQGEVTEPPSLQDYGTTIQKDIKEAHPAESSSLSTANAADAFFSLLKTTRVG